MSSREVPWFLPAATAILIPNVGNYLSSCLVRNNIEPFYSNLKKPTWGPPAWSFTPIWTVIYTGTGYGSYMVFKHGGGFNGPARIPLILYGTQMLLNWAWNPIFFRSQNIKLALYDCLALDAAVIATAYTFYKVNKTAGLIFVPYLLWLGIETAINYSYYKLNTKKGATITEVKND